MLSVFVVLPVSNLDRSPFLDLEHKRTMHVASHLKPAESKERRAYTSRRMLGKMTSAQPSYNGRPSAEPIKAHKRSRTRRVSTRSGWVILRSYLEKQFVLAALELGNPVSRIFLEQL